MERTIISFDYAIKTVLRDKENFDVLEGFLSELMKRKVTILDILESESNKVDKDGKTNRVDLKARMDTGEVAIFEIQYSGQADFFGKALYGVSKAIVEQISAGEDYNIKKIYSINIAYFELDTKREYMFHADMLNFKGVNYDEQIPFSLYDTLTPPTPKEHIHPEYYLILPKKFDEQIRSKFDEWIYTLKNSVVKNEFSAAGLQEAGEKLDMLKMTKEEREAYEKFLINRQSVDSAIRTAKAEGVVEGIEIGKTEGKMEEKLDIAKEMKTDGMPIEKIAKFTGLPAAEIEKL